MGRGSHSSASCHAPGPSPSDGPRDVGDWTFASSILPWRSCGSEPWGEGRHVGKTTRALDDLLDRLPRGRLIWGGDWNHAISGREYAGSIGGSTSLLAALSELDLTVPTGDRPHRIDGLLSIDHIAVSAGLDASLVGSTHRACPTTTPTSWSSLPEAPRLAIRRDAPGSP